MNTAELPQHQRLRDQLADAVVELTQPIRHEQPYTIWVNRNRKRRVHVTMHPCLLDQLADATDPGQHHAWPDNDGHGCAVPGSTPAARLSVVDLQRRIMRETLAWHRYLDHQPPPNLHRGVAGLVAVSGDADLDDLAELVTDVRRWRAWAKLLTGWATPPWSPRVPCPVCGTLGQLRVWLDRSVAGCGHDDCRAWWDEHTIGILGNYIRTYTDAADGTTAQERAVTKIA